MSKAAVEWTDARLNDLAATVDPIPGQLAGLVASVEYFDHVATHLEPLPAQLAVLSASVERLTEEHRTLRAELASAQRQLLQMSWALFLALVGAAAAVAGALI
jgi:hypothetical protein